MRKNWSKINFKNMNFNKLKLSKKMAHIKIYFLILIIKKNYYRLQRLETIFIMEMIKNNNYIVIKLFKFKPLRVNLKDPFIEEAVFYKN